ncbi:uncharacterized protein GLRG_07408 [Colletotrichum graminicola M1.001]|uniref:Uncharacterized protein n=1 Tax=Colletotrichum graminicola (strain M1.001 / M2 / FGSC 10212) TaxID=645133 RepID=E3QN26_COLGM|nr:uncharacterized protein GLRG_07408 [Colletotrichum graminicola M1.001]EFQ32264.1 hypothetical protein GLRG_07408 [Colletotrichum graminicola M1.001]
MSRCRPWEQIVQATTTDITYSVRKCVGEILGYIGWTKNIEGASGDVETALETVIKDFRQKVDELMRPYRYAHPLIYNRTVIQRVWSLQDSRRKAKTEAQRLTGGKQKIGFFKANRSEDWDELLTACDIESNLHRQACELASDYTTAYYEDALQGFISNFGLYAVEECLLSKLKTIFEVEQASEESEKPVLGEDDSMSNSTIYDRVF